MMEEDHSCCISDGLPLVFAVRRRSVSTARIGRSAQLPPYLLDCDLVLLLERIVTSRLRVEQARKLVLELDNCRNLRRWIHSGADGASVNGVAQLFTDLISVRDSILNSVLTQPQLLKFILSFLADGLLSSSHSVRNLSIELTYLIIQETALQELGDDIPNYRDMTLEWLCGDRTLGIEYWAASIPLEENDAGGRMLVELVFKLFHGEELYTMFAHSLMLVGSTESCQNVCNYSNLCRAFLREVPFVVRAQLIQCGVVGNLWGLGLHVLETTMLSPYSSVFQGGLFLCSVAPKCLNALTDLLFLLTEEYMEVFCHLQLQVNVAKLFDEHIPYWFSCWAVDESKAIEAERVVEFMVVSMAQARIQYDNQLCDLVDFLLDILEREKEKTTFCRVLSNKLARLTAFGASPSYILMRVTEMVPISPILFDLLSPLVHKVFHTCSDAPLCSFCDLLGEFCFSQGRGIEARTIQASKLLLAILTSWDVGTRQALQLYRSAFLQRCVKELEVRHAYHTASRKVEQQKKRQEARDQMLIRKAEAEFESGGACFGYSRLLEKTQAEKPRRKPKAAMKLSRTCRCIDNEEDRVLRNLTRSLVAFELQVDREAAELGHYSDQRHKELLLWSDCPNIQSILDEARHSQQEVVPPPKLTPIDPDTLKSPTRDVGSPFLRSPVGFGIQDSLPAPLDVSDNANIPDISKKSPNKRLPPQPTNVTKTPTTTTGATAAVMETDSLHQPVPGTRKRVQLAKIDHKVDHKVHTELRELEAKTKEKKRNEETVEQERIRKLQARHDKQKAKFAAEREKRKLKQEQQHAEKLLAEEVQKEYLDLKDNGSVPIQDLAFESILAERQCAWVGDKHMTKSIADLVAKTVGPYRDTLRKLFKMFASKGVSHEDTFQSMLSDNDKMSSKEWVAFLRSFLIVPQVIPPSLAKDIFVHAPSQPGKEMGYTDFLKSLLRIAENDVALNAMWLSSGFVDITGSPTADQLHPGWYPSRRGKCADLPGPCPSTRMFVLLEHLRNVALRDFRLGKCLGTWPSRRKLFADDDAIRTFRPGLQVALEVLDSILADVTGQGLLVDSPSSFAAPFVIEPPSQAGSIAAATNLFDKHTKAQAVHQLKPNTSEKPKPKTSPFAKWLHDQKKVVRKRFPQVVSNDAAVLDLEACARVMWRLIDKVVEESKPVQLTQSIQRGQKQYQERIRAQLEAEREVRSGALEKKKLDRQRQLYEKERDRIEEEARDKREQKQQQRQDLEREQQAKELVLLKQRMANKNRKHHAKQNPSLNQSSKTAFEAQAQQTTFVQEETPSKTSGDPVVPKDGKTDSKTVETKASTPVQQEGKPQESTSSKDAKKADTLEAKPESARGAKQDDSEKEQTGQSPPETTTKREKVPSARSIEEEKES